MTEEEKGPATKIKESAHRVWLAGLGALAVAEEEGGKAFEHLVEKGEGFEARGREKFDKVKEKAEGQWEKLGGRFDAKVAAALERLGIPSGSEMAKLRRKLDELTEKMAELKSNEGAEKTN